MAGMRDYDANEQDYVDACRSRVETQVTMFREVAQAARDHGDADVLLLEGALDSLESEYANNLVIVLENCFVDRPWVLESRGGPVQEVRLLARSLRENAGTLLEDPHDGLDPARTVLRLVPGDPVRLTLQPFARLADAFFREAEARLAEGGRADAS